jgi:Flp pilus assembly pilin Flp
MRLSARSGRERGQSLTEYGLILALVLVATIAVLGLVGSAVSHQLASVTTALRGEGEKSPLLVSVPLPSLVAIGLLVAAVVGVYLSKMRRG